MTMGSYKKKMFYHMKSAIISMLKLVSVCSFVNVLNITTNYSAIFVLQINMKMFYTKTEFQSIKMHICAFNDNTIGRYIPCNLWIHRYTGLLEIKQ